MTMKSMIEQAEQDLLHTYNRYQIVLDHGEDVYLYDAEGKKYLDFMSGIGVFALGYSNEYYNNALKEQIGKILHTSNYFYNEPAIKAAHRMKEISGMDRVFFANSGAEAVEGALKAAIKYAYVKDGASDHQVIALEHSFHGRTYGALSVTGNSHYREAFGAMPCEARFAKMNDMDSILNALTDKTCAIIMEVVQGEGGIVPAKEEFLRAVRDLCNERDILLIFGSRIREYRIRLKMTQRELAEKSGLSVLTIHRFENGSSQNISLSVFILLVKSLGMVDRLDNLLPELPPSPYEFNEKGKRVQRIRHKKN